MLMELMFKLLPMEYHQFVLATVDIISQLIHQDIIFVELVLS